MCLALASAWYVRREVIDLKRARIITVLRLYKIMWQLDQESLLSGEITLPLRVLVVEEDTSCPAHVSHFLQTGLSYTTKPKYYEKPDM